MSSHISIMEIQFTFSRNYNVKHITCTKLLYEIHNSISPLTKYRYSRLMNYSTGMSKHILVICISQGAFFESYKFCGFHGFEDFHEICFTEN